ncbi:poly-beta-hydroxybutyrate polymerase [Bordetella holmesii 30539]|uniref:Poly-beta-hydroxybutyrate polymerase n=2 Tax=Bordetella holmesii TaxID=35814 RepID=A0A158M3K0_9BORD|nr:poly-beta-hydroxybutyrate polymerase [Bordetella holmesii 44057]EWM44193.1 poly-beta-hydroxybutyrate polymerase [Bordetella holmesii 41130]EWM47658.1 poly-beta-hydroxybutyrate polymerase [Bordetella holmesii 35009]EXF87128.1 poly-beta-hydroxybutyrate polymerase [Bordetella holmesii 30539]EXX93132.1 poly-beta-hydroxybutyrate polymerase [Bordetella holmesii 1058]KAK84269.1 poly-beta-hydroxybutyrate polymerase [Bordetella holmesii CDC-H572-BH]KAK84990.1 poly-beta-hydroxybutyrate polymerase [B
MSVAPDTLADIQAEFSREWLRICDEAQRGVLPVPADRRFSSPAWQADKRHLLMAHAYLLSSRVLHRMVESAQVSEQLRTRLRFSIMQWVDALSPANFLAFNPDAQQCMVESAGRTLNAGLANLLADLKKGRITQTDESQFEIGRNVAVTPGVVVYENRLMQLIQYSPQTAKVFARPLVVVPPNINKFYILDLQPENSFVRHAVEAGHTVFIVSWRNPLASDSDGVDTATWSDYLDEAVLKALSVAGEITGQKQVNALGFCVGGTMLAAALALADARGQQPVASLTLLTSLLDFHDTGVLKVFVDEGHALLRDQQLGQGGLMPARDLATTFSFLRPNELVWNYVVGNYLKGQAPPAFDLLFWNADSTNLPGPFFSWYFRNTYLENNLKVPGLAQAADTPLDLTRLAMPAYVYGSREDHIVPWQSAYATTQLLRGPMRFVLGASGHIAGVINPPAKKRRSFWAGESDAALPGDPNAWLADASEQPGSWWPDWTQWLAEHAGKPIAAPRTLGSKKYAPIEPAPGRYVKVRAV